MNKNLDHDFDIKIYYVVKNTFYFLWRNVYSYKLLKLLLRFVSFKAGNNTEQQWHTRDSQKNSAGEQFQNIALNSYQHTHIHTYILGHYTPSVSITI